MRKALCLFLIFVLCNLCIASPVLKAQQPAHETKPTSAELTNQDVLDMIKSGLATEVIVAKIKSSPSKFDTSPATLAELKTAGVNDSIVMAMVTGREHTEAAPVTLADAKVPDGTEIEIQLQNTLSGQEAKVGDVVDFTVVRDVEVNGVVVFQRDAPARAKVTTSKKAGRWGKAGKLEWAMQDIQGADGNRIPARFTKRELGDSKGGTVAVAAVATTVLLGPLGLLWGLKKGKPAIIPAGNRYSVFVHGDTTIKGKVTANAANTR
ncbi:MAG TPA: hypothetical protein VIB00_00705 [Pyrinomonadaceae bacterium]|jgi:hypothetical protein